MKQGEAQVHLWPGEDKKDYDAVMAGTAEQVLVPGIWNMAIDFNQSKPGDKDPSSSAPHPILGDIRVRRAISDAIDYDTLINNVMHGQVSPSTNPFAYGWYKCDIPRMYNYDVEKAKQLLTEAGWVEGPDGIRVAKGAKYAEDGTRLSLELQGYTSFEPLERTEQFIVENLKAVGIEANIQNYDFSIIFEHILPSAMAPIIVTATLEVANAILSEAYISFLGMGVQPPAKPDQPAPGHK